MFDACLKALKNLRGLRRCFGCVMCSGLIYFISSGNTVFVSVSAVVDDCAFRFGRGWFPPLISCHEARHAIMYPENKVILPCIYWLLVCES